MILQEKKWYLISCSETWWIPKKAKIEHIVRSYFKGEKLIIFRFYHNGRWRQNMTEDYRFENFIEWANQKKQ